MTSPTDKTVILVEAAKSGDAQARNALYEKHWQKILSVVRLRMGGLLRSKMESRDIVQSVLLESLQSLQRFEYRSEGAFLHWLSMIVENKIRDKADYLTAKKRDLRCETAGDVEEVIPAPLAAMPSAKLQEAEELYQLEMAIGRLPAEDRDLIIMNKLEGLTYAEIAQVQRRTPEAVRKATARSLLKLSALLGSAPRQT